jgi:hypothetical protein
MVTDFNPDGTAFGSTPRNEKPNTNNHPGNGMLYYEGVLLQLSNDLLAANRRIEALETYRMDSNAVEARQDNDINRLKGRVGDAHGRIERIENKNVLKRIEALEDGMKLWAGKSSQDGIATSFVKDAWRKDINERMSAIEKLTCIKGNENANDIASATARVAANEARIKALEKSVEDRERPTMNWRFNAIDHQAMTERLDKLEPAVASLKLLAPPPQSPCQPDTKAYCTCGRELQINSLVAGGGPTIICVHPCVDCQARTQAPCPPEEDPAEELIPCPKCGGTHIWTDGKGWRCCKCDPNTASEEAKSKKNKMFYQGTLCECGGRVLATANEKDEWWLVCDKCGETEGAPDNAAEHMMTQRICNLEDSMTRLTYKCYPPEIAEVPKTPPQPQCPPEDNNWDCVPHSAYPCKDRSATIDVTQCIYYDKGVCDYKRTHGKLPPKAHDAGCCCDTCLRAQVLRGFGESGKEQDRDALLNDILDICKATRQRVIDSEDVITDWCSKVLGEMHDIPKQVREAVKEHAFFPLPDGKRMLITVEDDTEELPGFKTEAQK